MSQPLFTIAAEEVVGSHKFVRVVPVDQDDLVTALAPRIRQAYFDVELARARLRRAVTDLELFDGHRLGVTEGDLTAALADELDAILPAEWKEGGRPSSTDVRRSELAEIVAMDVLTEVFLTAIPASRIAEKEVPDQQSRGVDVLGLEDITETSATLVLGEVKGSCQDKSPPAVVQGMETKLKQLAADNRALRQELIWLRDHADDAHAPLCALLCAAFLLRRWNPRLVLTPVLVRTAGAEGRSDHGAFRTNPESFGHPIRFVSVIIDHEDLFTFAMKVYAAAKELQL